MLAAYKYIQGVNTREAEELFKLEDSVGVGTNGCEFIQFSLGGLSRGSATASHRRRVGVLIRACHLSFKVLGCDIKRIWGLSR